MRPLLAIACAAVLGACASLPPPTGELSAAQQAVTRADGADADQYAPDVIAQARSELAQAQAAMAKGRDEDARSLAVAAAADAELAHATSSAATTRAEYAQRRAEVVELQQRLQLQGDIPSRSPLEIPAAPGADTAGTQAARLQALEADPRLGGFAAYERLRAQQAVDALAAARSSQREHAARVAARRVSIAELVARTEATRREIDRLDRERSELLVEASRQEAERARQEAERLRVQAQIQAEEAQRLRAAADAEAAARQQAEDVIVDVAGDQTAKLAAARAKEAGLARQEAELMAGGKLPPSKIDTRGEVYTLGGDAFTSGQAGLTSSAAASVQTLGAYLRQGSNLRVRIEGHTDGQGEAATNLALSQQRAGAVRDALVAAGVPKARIQAVGRGESDPLADDGSAEGRARNRRVEIIVSGK